MSDRSIDTIVRDFNTTIRELIAHLERKSRSDIEVANLDRLRKRISLLKSTMGVHQLVHLASPFFIQYADKIIKRDEDFFNNMDVHSECVKITGGFSKQDEFILSLTDSIKSHYNNAPQAEKDEVYRRIKFLLQCGIEYKLQQ